MKTVLITGSSSEIGQHTAKKFASNHYNIILTYYQNKESAEQIAKELEKDYKVSCYAFYCDLHEESSIIKLLENIKQKHLTIDCLVNNAAICYEDLYPEKNKEKFMDTLEVNVVGTFLVSKIIGEEMYQSQKGTIINVASTNGLNQYYPMTIDYDASKAAILSLTNNLSLAYSPYLRVNAVAPGFIATKKEVEGIDNDFLELEQEKIFLKRLGKPEEVAQAIYFLASDEATYINNIVIKVDGGVR